MLICFAALIAASRFYGGFISRRLFRIDANRRTPAYEQKDGVDFVPTRKAILFGHHYTSIAGVAPMVGPAIAVIWGWLPAILWVVLGSIFIGGIHDFASLIISARRQGKSIGEITGELISPATKLVLLFIFFFLLLVVIALFAYVIAFLFTKYTASVLPIWFQVPLALLFGWIIYRKKGNLALWSAIMVVIMLLSVWGSHILEERTGFVKDLTGCLGQYAVGIWIIILLVYVFFASTLPVHRLLQPRDFINSYMLFVSMALITLGIIIARPSMVAPAIRANVPSGTPPLIPMLFVTIACGAVSGFHCLVSSGTSSKQLSSECDAQLIGYGGMIAEGALAVLAIIAAGAGLSAVDWGANYAEFTGTKQGLDAFIGGTSHFVTEFTAGVGLDSVLPLNMAEVFVAVVVICFAATTLDTATRVQRFVVSEIASTLRVKGLGNRYLATLVAVGTAGVLAFSQGWQGNTGKLLWQIFGTINQLLAAMALLIATVYLRKRGRNIAYSVLPMIFLLFITGWAMIWKVRDLFIKHETGYIMLVVIGTSALVLELFVVVFGVRELVRGKRERMEKPA